MTELTREMEECIPGEYDPATDTEAKELAAEINAFLLTLSKEKRDVFIRRYWFFDTVSDIAERLGCRESRVKTMLFRMRGELREHLTKKGYIV